MIERVSRVRVRVSKGLRGSLRVRVRAGVRVKVRVEGGSARKDIRISIG